MSVLSAVQTLVQAVLAALGPSQNQRLLRLHTPLGPNVLLAERMHGTESIGPRPAGHAASAGYKFEVLALSTNAHLQLKDLIGQPVRLDLLTQQSATQLRPFHGHVTAFALLGSDGGLARYKLTIEPWLSFLGHRQDAWVFQDKTVMQIVDEVFADYQAQGKLSPAWRWELADAAVYPKRSLCIQYHESDLAFVQRLLAEEGLFCWFEHGADEGESLGQHTLVIADHNGCFQPNIQVRVRYTQSASASFKEDGLTQFQEVRRIAPTALSAASWDHRSLQQASGQSLGDARLSPAELQLSLRDQPGAYAYEDGAQAQRIVQRQLEAIQAAGCQYQGQGGLRQAACATTFTLSEHPSVRADTHWVTLAVQHRGRNNITADVGTSLQALLGRLPQAFAAASENDGDSSSPRVPKPSLFKGTANQTTEPLYEALLLAQDTSVPVRAVSSLNEHGDIVFCRPQVAGAQTAVVVGLGEPVHTDRDGRIKVQFHWQRGAASAHRLDHPAGSNAPGDDSTGTWVRVSQAWAGANWGGHHTPRLGQEVLVGFVEADIDRAVVIGSVYNGQGQQDAQGNQVAAGAATSTGNAGSWFPGNQKAGELEGHQHPQVLAGFKSQSLDASQSGTGGYNQLVLDDSPGQARVTLGSTSAATWLQLGHLLQQNDNQRLAPRGHGFDLATTAYGAVRSGAGLHLTTYADARGSQANVPTIEARAAIAQVEQANELIRTLADSARKHNAKLSSEKTSADLPVSLGLVASAGSLTQMESYSSGAGVESSVTAGALEGTDFAEEGQVFDEQICFVNARGTALSGLKYTLKLADGNTVSGVTDGGGRTQRIVTNVSQPVTEATLHPRELASCCAAHDLLADDEVPPLTFPVSGIATNDVKIGSSEKRFQTPKGKSRALTAGEIQLASLVFKDSVDYSAVRIHNGEYLWFGLQPDDTAMTPNGEMYFSPKWFSEDFSLMDASQKHWFMHEMVHVWQYQLGYPVKWRGAVRVGLSYEYTLDKTSPLASFNMEAQGDVIADYFALKHLHSPQAMRQRQYADSLRVYEDVTLAGFLDNPSSKRNLPSGE